MGTTNDAGIYEYDSSDGALGPVMLNLLSASITASLTDNKMFWTASSTSAQTALVADLGTPLLVYRTDVTSGQNLRYTVDGSTWYILDFRDSGWLTLPLRSGYTAVSGFTPQYRMYHGKIEFRGRVTNTGGSMAGGSSFYCADVPSGYRPPTQALRPATPGGTTTGAARVWCETSGAFNVSVTATSTYVDISTLSYFPA